MDEDAAQALDLAQRGALKPKRRPTGRRVRSGREAGISSAGEEETRAGETCGAILLDELGRVCATNPLAAALLAVGEGLDVERGRLRTEDPAEGALLRDLVRSATGDGAAREAGVVTVSRAARHHALVVSVTPLYGAAYSADRAFRGALVLLHDPEDPQVLSESVLRRLYRLTGAEARVAMRIAEGETIDQIAAALGVRRTTVRSHVREALAKTGTHRQTDLVRLLLTGVRLDVAAPAVSTSPRTRPPHPSSDAPRRRSRRGR